LFILACKTQNLLVDNNFGTLMIYIHLHVLKLYYFTNIELLTKTVKAVDLARLIITLG